MNSEPTALRDIESQLAILHSKSTQAKKALNLTIKNGNYMLPNALDALDTIQPQILSAGQISDPNLLSSTASTATLLANLIRQVETEKLRVSESLSFVDSTLQLQKYVDALHKAMNKQNWEAAAQQIHLAITTIPANIIDSDFAKRTVPTSLVPLEPRETLTRAATLLNSTFLQEFASAAAKRDMHSISRFIKLFPLIGHPQDGLSVYSNFLRKIIATQARSLLATINNPPSSSSKNSSSSQYNKKLIYGLALAGLFDHIISISNQHTPFLGKHYGKGKMINTVLAQVQSEVDIQGGIILDIFYEERNLSRTLKEIKSYPFPFLVQAFLPSFADSNSMSSSDLTNHPSLHENDPNNTLTDVKSLDALLKEIEFMLARYVQYESSIATLALQDSLPSSKNSSPSTLIIPSFISQSRLNKKIHSILISPYEAISTFFFRRSVEKTFMLEELPSLSQPDTITQSLFSTIDSSNLMSPSSRPNSSSQAFPNKTVLSSKVATEFLTASTSTYISTVVDDAFYVVRAILTRAIYTGQVDLSCTIISNVRRVLESDYLGILQRRIVDLSSKIGLKVSSSLHPSPSSTAVGAASTLLSAAAKTAAAAEIAGRLGGTAAANLGLIIPAGSGISSLGVDSNKLDIGKYASDDDSENSRFGQGGFPALWLAASFTETDWRFIVLVNSVQMSLEYLQKIIFGDVSASSISLNNSKKKEVEDYKGLVSTSKEIFVLHDSSEESTNINNESSNSNNENQAYKTKINDQNMKSPADTINHLLSAVLLFSFSSRVNDLTKNGAMTIFNNMIKPKMRNIIATAFSGIFYNYAYYDNKNKDNNSSSVNNENLDKKLTESLLADDSNLEERDKYIRDNTVKSRFIKLYDAIMVPVALTLLPKIYSETLEPQIATEISRQIEKYVWSLSQSTSSSSNKVGNANTNLNGTGVDALGAIRLERDVASIVGHVCRHRYNLRSKFSRIAQIVSVIGMDQEEVSEILESSAEEAWVIVADDITRASQLRVDF